MRLDMKARSAPTSRRREPTAQASRGTLPAGRASRPALPFVAAGILLVTALVFAPVVTFGFVTWDDGPYVFENTYVLSGLSPRTLAWAFTNHTPYWHPLTWMSHLLDVTLLGPGPHGMHAVNVAIHLANTALLLILLNRLTSRLAPSAIVAALFALHPLHVESVAWIAERKDLLSTCFLFASLLFYQRYARRPSAFRYAGVVSAFGLSLMCKPTFVTLPVLLLLLDYWPLARFASGSSLARLCVEKVPLALVSVASAVVTYIGQQRTGTVSGFEALPIGARLANAVVSYAAYLRKTVWPADLAAFYPYPTVPPSTLAVVTACLTLAALTGLALSLRRRRPYLLFGWLWYVITLLPVIGLIQVGNQAMADRFSYVPLIGIFVMSVWAAAEAARDRHARLVAGGAAVIALIGCTALTRAQVLTWSSATTMWIRVLEVTPDSFYAHSALGVELADQGNLEAARLHQEEALRLHPADPDAHNELGKLAADRGDLRAAIGYFAAAVERNQNFGEALHNLGTALLRSGRPADAIEPLRRASDLRPEDSSSRRLMGEALAATGRWREATEAFQSALRLEPDSAIGHFQLGWVLDQQTRLPEAIVQYEAAVALDKRFAEAFDSLGVAYGRTGDLDRARAAFETAVGLDSVRVNYRVHLALALERTGRHEEAVRQVEAGLRAAPADQSLVKLLEGLRGRR
jgi:tetratricopeptide (TPR) repeat protein